jgi:hypothetical protein
MNAKTILMALTLFLATTTTGCFWLITGGDKSNFPDGTYKEIDYDDIEVTKKVTPFPGLTLHKGSKVHFSSGRLKSVVTAKPLKIDEVKVPAGSELYFVKSGKHLHLDSAVVGEDVSYGELEFRKGTELMYQEDGTPKYAYLKGKHTFEGQQFRSKTEIWFEDGEILKTKTLAQRDAERAARNRQRQQCRNHCAPLSGASHSQCIANCG